MNETYELMLSKRDALIFPSLDMYCSVSVTVFPSGS